MICLTIKKNVITNINAYIKKGLTGKQSSVAIIEGAAGTGKSVVLMELVRQYMTDKRYKTSLVVNHPELYKAYREMGTAIPNMNVSTIRRPTSLINYAQKKSRKIRYYFCRRSAFTLFQIRTLRSLSRSKPTD